MPDRAAQCSPRLPFRARDHARLSRHPRRSPPASARHAVRVIDQIDSALAAWLTAVLKPPQVEITFRVPETPPSQRKPLVCAALYDIVEEESARTNHVED